MPANETGDVRRQVVRPGIDGAERGERGGQSGHDELEEVLRLDQILEPVPSEIAQREAVGKRRRGEFTGRAGQHDLTTMAGARHASRAMDVDAHVVIAAALPLAGMESGTHLERDPGRPRMSGQTSQDVGGRRHRCRGTREDAEEGIAFGRDHHALVRRDPIPDDRCVRLQDIAIPVAELLEQARRTLDVGE